MTEVGRRESDPPNADYRHERHDRPAIIHRVNGHTKWFVGIGSTALVAALGWLMIEDRGDIETTAEAAYTLSVNNDAQIRVMQANLSAIRATLERIEEKLEP